LAEFVQCMLRYRAQILKSSSGIELNSGTGINIPDPQTQLPPPTVCAYSLAGEGVWGPNSDDGKDTCVTRVATNAHVFKI